MVIYIYIYIKTKSKKKRNTWLISEELLKTGKKLTKINKNKQKKIEKKIIYLFH